LSGSVPWSDFSAIDKLEQQHAESPTTSEQQNVHVTFSGLSKGGFTRPQPRAAPISYFRVLSSEGDCIAEGKEISYSWDKIRVRRTTDGVAATLVEGD
jgi:hypothetical protein